MFVLRNWQGILLASLIGSTVTLLTAATTADAQSADSQPQLQAGVDVGGGPDLKGGLTPMISPHLIINPVPQLRVDLYLDVMKTQHYIDQSDRLRFLALHVSPVVSRGPRGLFFFTAGVGVLWRVNETMVSTVTHQTRVQTRFLWGVGIPLGAGFQVVLSSRLALTGQGQIIFLPSEGGTFRSAIGISIPLGQSFRKP